MFNSKVGVIDLGKLIIKPHMNYSELEKNILSNEIFSCEISNSINVLMQPQQYDNKFFIIRLYFDINNKELFLCHISIQHVNKFLSWEEMSEENELKRKKENEEWLLSETGKMDYKYNWGNVKSIYNSLEGSSYIVIKYI